MSCMYNQQLLRFNNKAWDFHCLVSTDTWARFSCLSSYLKFVFFVSICELDLMDLVSTVMWHFCSRIGKWSGWSIAAWTGSRAKLIIFPVCGGTGSKFGCWWAVPSVISHFSVWSHVTFHTWLLWWRVWWYFQWPGSQLAIHWN